MGIDSGTLIGSVTFAAIDFESAGVLRGETDTPIQVGWGFLLAGEIDPKRFFRRYLFTDRPVTWSAQKVHGISKAHLEEAEKFENYWPELKQQLGHCVLVAHGHGTEKKFLQQFPGHGLGPWVDTLTLARRWCEGLESHRLEEVVSGLDLEEELRDLCPDYNWHDALFDSIGCLVILRKMIEDGKLSERPLKVLLDT
ncbi:MAG: 3'-5' exonuclease [Verrucomicrobiota bacterium]